MATHSVHFWENCGIQDGLRPVLSGPHGLEGYLPISMLAPYSHHVDEEKRLWQDVLPFNIGLLVIGSQPRKGSGANLSMRSRKALLCSLCGFRK